MKLRTLLIKESTDCHSKRQANSSGQATILRSFDEAHSVVEERLIAIGMIRRGLIVVVWTETEEGTVRLISARSATKREEALYESHMGKGYE